MQLATTILCIHYSLKNKDGTGTVAVVTVIIHIIRISKCCARAMLSYSAGATCARHPRVTFDRESFCERVLAWDRSTCYLIEIIVKSAFRVPA